MKQIGTLRIHTAQQPSFRRYSTYSVVLLALSHKRFGMPDVVDPLLNNLQNPWFDNLAIETLWKRMTTFDGVDTSVFPQHNPNHTFSRPLWFGILTSRRLTKFVLRHPEEFAMISGVNFGRPGTCPFKEAGVRQCISELFLMFTYHSYHVSHGCPHGDFESVSEERGIPIGTFTIFRL